MWQNPWGNPYRQGGQQYRPYNNSNRYSRSPRKRSGCKQSQKDGRIVISGWKRNRQGFYSLVAIENSKSDTKSKRWFKMTAKITNKNTMVSQTYPALWDSQKNRMVISQLGYVANPAKNYFGRGGVPLRINNR